MEKNSGMRLSRTDADIYSRHANYDETPADMSCDIHMRLGNKLYTDLRGFIEQRCIKFD